MNVAKAVRAILQGADPQQIVEDWPDLMSPAAATSPQFAQLTAPNRPSYKKLPGKIVPYQAKTKKMTPSRMSENDWPTYAGGFGHGTYVHPGPSRPPLKRRKKKLSEAKVIKTGKSIPKPNRKYDVPYGAGMDYTGDEWYLDRDIDPILDVKGTKVDIIPPWYTHEMKEHIGIDKDLEYPVAHAAATAAEKSLLAKLYPTVKWEDYDEACQKVLKVALNKAKKGCGNNCSYKSPDRLDRRQYQEENELHLLHYNHKNHLKQ